MNEPSSWERNLTGQILPEFLEHRICGGDECGAHPIIGLRFDRQPSSGRKKQGRRQLPISEERS